jgi:hypothetical protein
VSDIDTAAADSLKALDPKRPIREADISVPTLRRATRAPSRALVLSVAFVKYRYLYPTGGGAVLPVVLPSMLLSA